MHPQIRLVSHQPSTINTHYSITDQSLILLDLTDHTLYFYILPHTHQTLPGMPIDKIIYGYISNFGVPSMNRDDSAAGARISAYCKHERASLRLEAWTKEA